LAEAVEKAPDPSIKSIDGASITLIALNPNRAAILLIGGNKRATSGGTKRTWRSPTSDSSVT
jgi:hypothetical protein